MDKIKIKDINQLEADNAYSLDYASCFVFTLIENNKIKTIIIGGDIQINKVYIINLEKAFKNFEEVNKYINNNKEDIAEEPIYKYNKAFLEFFLEYPEKGLEPSVITANASLGIFDKEYLEQNQNVYVPYIHQDIFMKEFPEEYKEYQESYKRLFPQKILCIKDKDFGVGIHGDAMHVSALLLKSENEYTNTQLENIKEKDKNKIYVFDSIGNIHFEKDEKELFSKFIVDINGEHGEYRIVHSDESVKSLNPFGIQIQNIESDSCGLWSSNTLIEASKYDNFDDFIKTYKYNGEEINMLSCESIVNISMAVSKQESYNDIIIENLPEEQEEQNKYEEFKIKEDKTVYVLKEEFLNEYENNSIKISNLKLYVEKFNELEKEKLKQLEINQVPEHKTVIQTTPSQDELRRALTKEGLNFSMFSSIQDFDAEQIGTIKDTSSIAIKNEKLLHSKF